MSVSELAVTYAALILHDDGIPITVSSSLGHALSGPLVSAFDPDFGWVDSSEKLSALVKAAGVTVESYWPSLFAKLLEKISVEDLITNVGSGGGGAVSVGAAPAVASGGAPAAEEKKLEEKVEEKEESDDDMGFSLFD